LVHILVCTQRQDMPRSFDTLAAVVRDVMREDPQSGSLYVFVGKRPTRVKVLWWDKTGFYLLTKRLHRALFVVPDTDDAQTSAQLDAAAFAQLLRGVGRDEKKRVRRLH
jgi:transposase